MAQTLLDATCLNIDVQHEELIFVYGIYFKMALRSMKPITFTCVCVHAALYLSIIDVINSLMYNCIQFHISKECKHIKPQSAYVFVPAIIKDSGT